MDQPGTSKLLDQQEKMESQFNLAELCESGTPLKNIEFAKKCLIKLSELHSENKYLKIIHPKDVQVTIDQKSKELKSIEFLEKSFDFENRNNAFWSAPELNKENSQFTEESNIFALGLIFHYLMTRGENPLEITFKRSKDGMKIVSSTISMEHLNAIKMESTDVILLIDLIKWMLEEELNKRGTIQQLMEHPLFMSFNERRELLTNFIHNNFNDLIRRPDSFLLNRINENKSHLIGFDEEYAKLSFAKLDYEFCTNILIKFFRLNGSGKIKNEIFTTFPNFFPHMYSIIRDESPQRKFKIVKFGRNFVHFANEELGRGANGTFVYKGKFNDRPIAIKKVPKHQMEIAMKEISIIQNNDHPNVLRYFGVEEDELHYYIGTELCKFNLTTFIKDPTWKGKISSKEIFKQLTDGLNYLHGKNILHRDIKPDNVLIHEEYKYSVKLSDFGVSKDSNATKTMATLVGNVKGTTYWIAPEVLTGQIQDKRSDIYSLGCVFYFIYTNGVSIMEDCQSLYSDIPKNLNKLKSDHGEEFMQIDLMRRMLEVNPKDRPSMQEILNHILFWTDEKRYAFICEISKRLNALEPENTPENKNALKNYKKNYKDDQQKRIEENLLTIKEFYERLNEYKIDSSQLLEIRKIPEFKELQDYTDFIKRFRNNGIIFLLFQGVHKSELDDETIDIIEGYSSSDYLKFVAKFVPMLPFICYRAAIDDDNARFLFKDYFVKTEAQIDLTKKNYYLTEDSLEFYCNDKIKFDEIIAEIRELKIFNPSHVFVRDKMSFMYFLARNSNTLTKLVFYSGSLKCHSLNMILEKLPALEEIHLHSTVFDSNDKNFSKMRVNCNRLTILNFNFGELLDVFGNCPMLENLFYSPRQSLFTTLPQFPNLKELKVEINESYRVSDLQRKSHQMPQLKVLEIEFRKPDVEKQNEILEFLKTQENVEVLDIQRHFMSEEIKEKVLLHILQMKMLHTLKINSRLFNNNLKLQECNASVTSLKLIIYSEENFYLSKSIFVWFPNLTELTIQNRSEYFTQKDFWCTLNESKLQSIKLYRFPLYTVEHIHKLHLESLTVFHISLNNEFHFQVPEVFFKNHPNLTDLSIDFRNNETSSTTFTCLLEMIVKHLAKLEKLNIQCSNSEMQSFEDIKRILSLSTSLKEWEIYEFTSKK